MIDLSKYRQNFVRDTEEEIKKLSENRRQPIPEGRHEVKVTGIFGKEGEKIKSIERCGGSLAFSLVVANASGAEQMIYVVVPLAVTFNQACNDADTGNKFLFKKTIQLLHCMGINPIKFRESVVLSNAKSVESLEGAAFVITNSWNPKCIHLEYDPSSKANYFVTSQGERFGSGEMSLPVHVDTKIPIRERYKEFVAVAYENGFRFSQQMDTVIEMDVSADNSKIQESIESFFPKAKPAVVPNVMNKTLPFPPKRLPIPEPVEPDIEY